MNAGADERRRARGTTKRADNNAIDLTTRGYVRVITPAYELVALKVLLASAQLVLSRHHSLYEWAAAQRQTHSLQGRAPVYVGTLPHGDAELAVRHVWHGGLFAPLTKDRFRVPTRAAVELRNSLRLRECGIPTSEIVGYALYPAGPGLRRIDVATRFIPCAVDLGSVLVNAASGLPLSNALRAVDSLLAALARHRV
ncbi:MAG: lipopolysaccharide kinase InaA family protein, partial [Gemmatimonas sp.]